MTTFFNFFICNFLFESCHTCLIKDKCNSYKQHLFLVCMIEEVVAGGGGWVYWLQALQLCFIIIQWESKVLANVVNFSIKVIIFVGGRTSKDSPT